MADSDNAQKSHSHADNHHDGDQQHSHTHLSHTEMNRQHWDKMAATYNSEKTKQEFGNLINKITEFIRTNLSWIGVQFCDPSATFEGRNEQESGKRVRVLDYACGPGTVTNAFVGYATDFIGIDLSQNMVKEYNQKFQDKGLFAAEGFVGNLLGSETDSEGFNDETFYEFDLVAVGLGFHHFENLVEVTQKLVDRLRSGGVLLIIDFVTHRKDDLQHEASHTVAHHGFGEEEVRSIYGQAGLQGIRVMTMNEQVLLRATAPRTVFMARGVKP